MTPLLTPREVDLRLRYPRGRSLRLARENKLPHVVLPDGEVRFSEDEIERLLTQWGHAQHGREVVDAAF